MATRKPTRSEWHKQDGKWSRSFGDRGTRIRLFQNRRGGVFYRAVWVSGKGFDRKSLGTRERDQADKSGKELLSHLLTDGNLPAGSGPVTLPDLWARYSTSCEAHLDNVPSSRCDDATRAAILIAYFGRTRDVRTISADDIARYVQRRRRGGIAYVVTAADGSLKTRMTRPGSQRSAHADLVAFRSMLRWGRTVYSVAGGQWLDHNPLDGMRFECEKNPKRPVASAERYQSTRKAVARLGARAASPSEREKWTRLELALLLSYETGRRRGSIVGLRWEDIDFSGNRITWRAEHDKKGKEWIIPMPVDVMEELRRFQRQLQAIRGLLFPMQRDSEKRLPAEMLSQWLLVAEAEAGLPKLVGGLWHPYRRYWASERMHLPVKAVADAGGWRDVTTLMRSYQHADEATLLAVMANKRPRSPAEEPPSAGSLSLVN